jgi:outer membrane PBP1 activator LpoA protein
MFMKKLMLLIAGMFMLNGCIDQKGGDWGAEWGDSIPTENPMEISDAPADMYGVQPGDQTLKTVAVLLPLSGAGGDLGTGIQHAIEIAFFQKQPKNIMVSFHDINGKGEDKERIMEMVLSTRPDIIIGPLFADDVEMLKKLKPAEIPAITFTSAKSALGDGIFTMALLPNQAVEAIVKQIKAEGKERLLVLAPNTQTGYMLANNAVESAKIYNLDLAGLYLYVEHDAIEIKDLAEQVSLYQARTNNLIHAKEILSDVLINQKLTAIEKESVKTQLEELNKRDSLGEVPYDAVLLLGNAADSKTLGAYLRYYDVNAAATSFYGSALWDTESVYRDASLAGGEYAGLPRISETFLRLYSEIEGVLPNRLNTIGFDAAMLSIKALSGGKPVAAYLLDPSGYKGLDGLVRLRPNGENERALLIMQLNGVRMPMIRKIAEQNFIKPIYQTTQFDLSKPFERNIASDGYNPLDYIKLPEYLADQYQSKKFGITYDDSIDRMSPDAEHVEVVSEDKTSAVIDADFKPAKLDPVDKKLIEEVRLKSD